MSYHTIVSLNDAIGQTLGRCSSFLTKGPKPERPLVNNTIDCSFYIIGSWIGSGLNLVWVPSLEISTKLSLGPDPPCIHAFNHISQSEPFIKDWAWIWLAHIDSVVDLGYVSWATKYWEKKNRNDYKGV